MNRFFFLFFLLFANFLFAQQNPPLRIELEAAKDQDDYSYQLLDKQGVMVFFETLSPSNDSANWVLIHYDTNLQKIHSLTTLLPAGYTVSASTFNYPELYIFFSLYSNKSTSIDQYLLQVNLLSHKMETHTLNNLPMSSSFNLHLIDHNLFITTSIEDHYYRIFNFNTLNKSITEFSIAETMITSIEFFETDTFNQRILLGLSLENSNQKRQFALYETTFQGALIRQHPFPQFSEYRYNSARLAVIDSSNALILGTFNNSEKKNSSNLHDGIYSLKYHNQKLDYPNFYNFSNIQNTKEKSYSANHNANLNLQLIVGDIYHDSTQYALVTEAYYPEYNYSPYTGMDSYYYGYTPSSSSYSFNGYRYVNAYITTFDTAANLLWEHYFPFTNLISFNLVPRINLFFSHHETALFYPYNDRIISSLVDGDDIVQQISSDKIESNYPNDIIDYSRNLKLSHWYNNSFILIGYQYIKNNSKSVKSKRYVFVLSKLNYQ